MCGLVALLGGSLDPPDARARIERGLDALQHRGPDDRGRYASPREAVHLGHVRLALVDPERGRQPWSVEGVHAVVTGEIYDDERLRQRLRGLGHTFVSACDSELIAHVHRRWGRDGIARLRGEFAFVVFDEARRQCVLARDRMGVRPLLFARLGRDSDGPLAIASEARGLFALGVTPEWDREQLEQALALQYPLPGRTLFAGVHSLRAGELATFDLASGRLVRDLYFRPAFPVPRVMPDDLGDATRRVVDRAVRRRLRGDASVCTLLSGGLDSTTVTALAARARREQGRPPPPAFTVRFPSPGPYDEAEQAAATARALGLEHHVIELRPKTLRASFPAAVIQGEGLAINAHIAAKRHLVAAIAEAGHRVVLTGEGADELLLGYAHLRADLGARPSTLDSTNAASAGLMLPGPNAHADGAAQGTATWIAAKTVLGGRVRRLLFDDRDRSETAVARLIAATPAPPGAEAVEVHAHRWSQTALAHYILQTLGDRTEMGRAVEARFPMLDADLVAFAASVPVGAKIRDGREKWCLREAMRGLVPEAVVGREKHPFLAPPWLSFEGERPSALAWTYLVERPARCVDARRARAVLDELGRAPAEVRGAYEPALALAMSVAILEEALSL